MNAEAAREKPTALVVYPQPGRTEELKRDIPEYRWAEAPNRWPQQPAELGLSRPPDVIVVDAEQESDDQILKTCETLRNMTPVRDTPVLVAISMYRMHLGNQVKQYPHTNILIFPIEDADLRRQLTAASDHV